MQMLTATRQGQGDRDGDFCHATEGELVLLEEVCRVDRQDPDGGCGCGRAFAGMNSHRATTTVVVRDVDLDWDDVALAVTGYFTSGGLTPELMDDPEDFALLVVDTTQEMIRFGQAWPVGTVLGRRLDSVRLRTRA